MTPDSRSGHMSLLANHQYSVKERQKERTKLYYYFTFRYELKTDSNVFYFHILEFILIICGAWLDWAGGGYLLTENLLPLHILVLAGIMW